MKAKPPNLTLAGREHIASAADDVRLPTKRVATGPQQADHGPTEGVEQAAIRSPVVCSPVAGAHLLVEKVELHLDSDRSGDQHPLRDARRAAYVLGKLRL